MQIMRNIAAAIDGPSGAGKSTVARAAALRLGFTYADTGAMYRAIGLLVYRKGISGDDTAGITGVLPEVDLELTYKNGMQRIILCGEDVSEEIRTPVISKYASKVSAVPEVRAFLLGLQREMAERKSIIMDGRDIGTVVLPNADVKIFLTASAETRAGRRYKELIEKGQEADYDQVLRDIMERDNDDMTRAAAPLKQAEDAVLLDTSDMDLNGSIESVVRIITEKTRRESGYEA